MAAYNVEARPRARRALRQIDAGTRKDVLGAMRALGTDPRLPGVKPLRATGHGSGYG